MYTYSDLTEDARRFRAYGGETFCIGESREGREIICFACGKGGKPLISTAAIHARENVSAYVVLAQLEYAVKRGSPARQYFIPLVNPDGAERLLKWYENGDSRFKLWKANAAGVDLNVNFDAKWGCGKQNVFSAGGENYVGERPFSEPESKALADFTVSCGAGLSLSYHTAGREFYWYFFQQENLRRDLEYACFIERELEFKYKRIDSDCQSAGGYKDWCVQTLKIPAFTIELGEGEHPLKRENIKEDICLNASLANKLSEKLNERR